MAVIWRHHGNGVGAIGSLSLAFDECLRRRIGTVFGHSDRNPSSARSFRVGRERCCDNVVLAVQARGDAMNFSDHRSWTAIDNGKAKAASNRFNHHFLKMAVGTEIFWTFGISAFAGLLSRVCPTGRAFLVNLYSF